MNPIDYAIIIAVAVVTVLCVIKIIKKPPCRGDCSKCAFKTENCRTQKHKKQK